LLIAKPRFSENSTNFFQQQAVFLVSVAKAAVSLSSTTKAFTAFSTVTRREFVGSGSGSGDVTSAVHEPFFTHTAVMALLSPNLFDRFACG
jgi:hypothetical protein